MNNYPIFYKIPAKPKWEDEQNQRDWWSTYDSYMDWDY